MRQARPMAVLLAFVLLALPAGASAATAPSRSADTIENRLFDAQTELLLDDPAAAKEQAERARKALAGTLVRDMADAAPGDLRALRRAVDRALEAATARDERGLAAARGSARGALYRGSYAVTLAAVQRGDVKTAREWLLLREFRQATRFTRPGVDATNAVRDLAARRAAPGAALLGVKKDLLDAYQARVADRLRDADAARKRGFGPKLAEASAVAAGYWGVLREEYRNARGAEALARADDAFDRLAASAAAGDTLAYTRAREEAGRALDGFTAAPFTPEEQARRATQLLRFLDLIPKEYRDGTDDGKVTVPFEVQEGVAFREAASVAFADLQPALEKRDPARTATAKAGLEQLRVYVEDASEGRKVVDLSDVEKVQERTHDALESNFPEEWKASDDQSDFDLIALTLDRMEAAAGAGEYKQAEQARLEAYAFFEFGPELQLRSIAPGVVADVEALVWFGKGDLDGLAKLIANERPRREIHETRLALDELLEDGAGQLGEGSSRGSIVVNAALIVFREGLEAVLILAAVMASLLGANRSRRRPMLIGASLALLASAFTFVLAQTVLTSLAQYGEKLEAIVGLVAIGVLLLVLNWFFHKVYWTQHISKFHKRRKRLLVLGAAGAQVAGFVLLGFSTVYREGFETVLFLQALELSAGPVVVLEGVLIGGLAVLGVAVATFMLERKLPYKKMLIVTGVLLGVVLMVMVGQTVRTLQGVGWMPITPIDVDVPYWAGVWFGVFPTVQTLVAQLAAGGFVIGSYFLAERMRSAKHNPPPPPAETVEEEREMATSA